MPARSNGRYTSANRRNERFGQNLVRIALRRGLTQECLARRMGMSRPSIANIEAGRQNINILQLVRMRQILQCSYADLLKGVSA